MNIKSLVLTSALATMALPLFAQANVRVINALPQSQGISVSVGQTQLFSSVQSNQITEFKPLPQIDGDQKITIQNGQQQLQTEDTFDLDDDDESYTILVTPHEDNANPKVVLLEDDSDDALSANNDIDQDEVELTVINAAPEHSSVNLRLNDDVKARGVNYSRSEDEDVDPGQYNLALLNASGENTIIAQKSVSLRGGTAVTVLLTSPNNIKIVDNNNPNQDLAGGGNAQAVDRQTTGSAAGMGTRATTGTVSSPGSAQDASAPAGATAAPQSPSNMTTPGMNLL